ncbi:MAG TPA: hypothetical protein VGU64_15860 [Terriglobales bacterium]|nr:hypothetical protein [Terriglobales bacterium]
MGKRTLNQSKQLGVTLKTESSIRQRFCSLSGNAINYAKFFTRSHDAVIRIYDDAGSVIETHEHTSDFKEW